MPSDHKITTTTGIWDIILWSATMLVMFLTVASGCVNTLRESSKTSSQTKTESDQDLKEQEIRPKLTENKIPELPLQRCDGDFCTETDKPLYEFYLKQNQSRRILQVTDERVFFSYGVPASFKLGAPELEKSLSLDYCFIETGSSIGICGKKWGSGNFYTEDILRDFRAQTRRFCLSAQILNALDHTFPNLAGLIEVPQNNPSYSTEKINIFIDDFCLSSQPVGFEYGEMHHFSKCLFFPSTEGFPSGQQNVMDCDLYLFNLEAQTSYGIILFFPKNLEESPRRFQIQRMLMEFLEVSAIKE